MHPVVDEFRAGHALDDSAVVIVMTIDVVYSTAVDIQLIAEVLRNYGGILYVPRGPSLSDFRVPGVPAVLVPVPQDEVAKVPPLARVCVL